MRFLAVTILGVLIAGCVTNYSPPRPLVIEKTRVFNSTHDAVWGALVSYFAERNFQMKLDRENGLIELPSLIYEPGEASEGIPEAQLFFRSAQINIVVASPSSQMITVQINTFTKMQLCKTEFGNPTNCWWRDTYSTGIIEKEIFQKISEKLHSSK